MIRITSWLLGWTIHAFFPPSLKRCISRRYVLPAQLVLSTNVNIQTSGYHSAFMSPYHNSCPHPLIAGLYTSTQEATCFISSNGIKVTVEQSKCVQANAFIQSSLFQYFSFRGESPAIFKINLMALIVSTNHVIDLQLDIPVSL